MIYLACVVRGQLDPVFSFKDEHKSEQDFKIKYNMYRYWNAVSVGYAQYYSIVMRTITLHAINVGVLENYTKSNNITKMSNELLQEIAVIERTNVTVIFTNIRTSKSTYYLLYDKFHSKTQTPIIPYSILLQILVSTAKK